ncbi:hypothetical protein BSKO_05987 [Bryopsis sp. KO-2023]|nr:hypothetical protein BSKO_05987 [Bryopsis sp. KO-2023]
MCVSVSWWLEAAVRLIAPGFVKKPPQEERRRTARMLVDTRDSLLQCLRDLETCMSAKDAVAAIDCEGVNLCRHGKLCTLQIRCRDGAQTYVIDVVTLTSDAFSISLESGFSIKSMLEDRDSLKLLFDPRNDSDALYHQFGVFPQNVFCLQLAEVAHRRATGKVVNYVMGLDKMIRGAVKMSAEKLAHLAEVKNQGKRLFAPEVGGSYEVWVNRPLCAELVEYAACDVEYLIDAYDYFLSVLNGDWVRRVREASVVRVEFCLGKAYSKGRHMAVAPQF